MSKDLAFDNENPYEDGRRRQTKNKPWPIACVGDDRPRRGATSPCRREHENAHRFQRTSATGAANVDLEDPIEIMGMKIVREARHRRRTQRRGATAPRRRPILSDAIVSGGSTLRHLRFRSAGAAPRHPARCPPTWWPTRFSRTPSRIPRVSRSPRIATVLRAANRLIGEKDRGGYGCPSAVTAFHLGREVSELPAPKKKIEVKNLKGMMYTIQRFPSPRTMADDPARLEGDSPSPYNLLTDMPLGDNYRRHRARCWKRSCSPVILADRR